MSANDNQGHLCFLERQQRWLEAARKCRQAEQLYGRIRARREAHRHLFTFGSNYVPDPVLIGEGERLSKMESRAWRLMMAAEHETRNAHALMHGREHQALPNYWRP